MTHLNKDQAREYWGEDPTPEREEALRQLRSRSDRRAFNTHYEEIYGRLALALASDLELMREESDVILRNLREREADLEAAKRERDQALKLGSAIYGDQQWKRAEKAERDLATAREALRDYERGRDAGAMDRLRAALRSLDGEET